MFNHNSAITEIDVLGLATYLDLPATPSKCDLVAALLAAWTVPDLVNLLLYQHWLFGAGETLTIGYTHFDPLGRCRREARDKIREKKPNAKATAEALDCDTEGRGPRGRFILQCTSFHRMINEWRQTTTYTIQVGKDSDGEECGKLWAKVYWTNKAADRFDFNPGDAFSVPGYDISDDLVNACGFGTDFDIKSSHHADEEWEWDCSGCCEN